MGRVELSPSTRSRICSLRTDAKLSYGEIASHFPSISRSTIITTCRREAIRGKENDTLKRSGRPRNLSEEERDSIYDYIQQNPSCRYYELLELVDYKICERTLRNLLKEFGLRKWRKITRPQLNDNDAVNRLTWAERYRDFTPEDWSRVYFSDETSIERGSGAGAQWTFVRPIHQAREGEIHEKPCGKQIRQMFWACINGDTRRTGLIPMDGDPESPRGGVTSRVIQSTYSTYLPSILSNRSDAIFMHDNASTHTAHIVRDLLNEIDVEVMQWPPHSPDLNPIENLWGLLKRRLLELFPELYDMPNNEETRIYLISAAQHTWFQIDPDILRKLSMSMCNRVQAIIESKGWYTTY
jgi:transposase